MGTTAVAGTNREKGSLSLLLFRVEIESGPNFVKNFTLLSFPVTRANFDK